MPAVSHSPVNRSRLASAAVPTAHFSHSATASVSLNDAWAQLQVPQTWQAIPGVNEVFDPQFEPDRSLTAFLFRSTAAGTNYEGTATVVSADAPTAMSLAIDSSEVAAIVDTSLTDVGGGSVEIAVSIELESKGFLAGMFFPVVARVVENGLPESVQEFADRISTLT